MTLILSAGKTCNYNQTGKNCNFRAQERFLTTTKCREKLASFAMHEKHVTATNANREKTCNYCQACEILVTSTARIKSL